MGNLKLMRWIVLGTVAILACSSSKSTDTGSSSSSGGTGTDPDGGVTQPDAAVNSDCFQKCFDQHPNAQAKLDAVDDCVGKSCSAECEGDLVDGGAGLCGTTSPSGAGQACDDCITKSCCTAWSGCFGDPDCNAYNACLSACPEE